MIERGGYGFGDRAAALLGSTASADILALVQQALRATNPAGFTDRASIRLSLAGSSAIARARSI
jgi:hypothetical protein